MQIKRTEQIWLKASKTLSDLCRISKNLYNEANYIVRQEFINNSKWIRYNELDKMLNGNSGTPSENYNVLPASSAQWVLKLLDKSWKGFFNARKQYKIHPEKFKSIPKMPGYKRKLGEHLLIFTNRQVKIKNYIIKFPKKIGKLEVKTRLEDNIDLREVRILPMGIGYVVEVVYNKGINPKKKDNSRMVGIDYGTANIIAIGNNIGKKPIVVKDNGKGIKSINQYFAKEKARIQSIYDLQKIKTGKKLKKLECKHKRKVYDYTHKISKFIVDWCIKNDIGKIVIGDNDWWKQNVSIGRRNNQTFVTLPYDQITNKIKYKSEEHGIEVVIQDESHTSKCSFLDNEPIEHHETYIGKRISRGLFKSKNGIIINADVNAGYNIMKKSDPKAFGKLDADGVGGCFALHPVRVVI